MDFDVTFRLRLEQDVESEGHKVEASLKDIREAADKLGRVKGADNLDRDLKGVRRTSRRTRLALREVKDAGDQLGRIRTDRATSEMEQLRRKARSTADQMRRVRDIGASGRVTALVGPMGKLRNAAVGLAGGLMAAFTVPEILRGMSEMKTRAEELETQLTRLLQLEGDFDPEQRAARQKRHDELGIRYGMTQDQILGASMALAQGGVVGSDQEAVLEPILKASKASGSRPEVIAEAVRALLQNLRVAPEDIPAALDRMLAGGKAGSFELEDMATFFPSLAATYANSGRTGLEAVEELVAMAQIVRENQGSSSQAGTALNEILSKIYSPEIIRRMDENNIDVRAIADQAQKAGEPLITALIAEIEKKGLTDTFGLGELVADKNAREALQALTTKIGEYRALLDQIREESDGTVDRDFEVIDDLGQSGAERRSAAWSAAARNVGETVVAPVWNWFWDGLTRNVSDEFDRQLDREEAKDHFKGRKTFVLENMLKGYQADLDYYRSLGQPEDGRPMVELMARIKALEVELKRRRDEAGGSAGETLEGPVAPIEDDTGTIVPVPTPRPPAAGHAPEPIPAPAMEQSAIEPGADPLGPFNRTIEGGLDESASKINATMDELRALLGQPIDVSPIDGPDIVTPPDPLGPFNTELEAELDESRATVAAAVRDMQAMLNFTASPTITPVVRQPPGGGQKTASAAPAGNTVINVNGTGNPQQVANRVVRAQNRQIRASRNGALHDTGAYA